MSDCSRVYSPVSLDGWELAGANTYFILGGALQGNSKWMLFQLFIHSPVHPPDRSSPSISWPPDIAPGNGDNGSHSNWRREAVCWLQEGGCLLPHHRSAALPDPLPAGPGHHRLLCLWFTSCQGAPLLQPHRSPSPSLSSRTHPPGCFSGS